MAGQAVVSFELSCSTADLPQLNSYVRGQAFTMGTRADQRGNRRHCGMDARCHPAPSGRSGLVARLRCVQHSFLPYASPSC